MITFACAQCGKQLKAADEHAGKKARCPDCRQPTLVPNATAMLQREVVQADAPTLPPSQRPQEAATLPPSTPVAGRSSSGTVLVPGYEILGELGRGGMGVVYKARQTKLRRLVALKMVLGGEHASPEELQRFRAEAESIARLKHPHIVQIHEFGEHDGRPYFSLEFVEAGSLAADLAKHRWTPRDTVEMLHKIARGMGFAHKRGVVHRDLKPANILLAGEDAPDGTITLVPKITDFGLAKQLEGANSMAGGGAKTASGAIMGTPSYMPPEQVSGKNKEIGPPADVYALGAILYEMLVGRVPFQGETTLDTLMQVATQDPVPPRQLNPAVPADLETICLKCLHKDPARRYANGTALADDLARWLDGEAIKARPQTRLEKVKRWAKKRKEVVYLWSGVLSALLVVGIVALFASSPGKDKGFQPLGPVDDGGEGGDGKGAIGRVQEAADRMTSSSNLKQMAIGFHNVDSTYGHMPPATITDPTGKPLLSWRVAILPYIEGDALFRQFRMNEPWDSPHNKQILDTMPMPKQYRIPGSTAPANHTHYQVFVGPGTAFDTTGKTLGGPFGRQGPRFNDFTDGTSNTILIAEASNAVPWTKPEDMKFDPEGPLPQLGGIFRGGSNIAFADGSVRFLSDQADEIDLRAAITAKGGETLPFDWETGNTKGKFDYPTVSGKVMFQGKPLSGVTINFVSQTRGKTDGTKNVPETYSTTLDVQGNYSLTRIQPDSYTITLTPPKGTPPLLPARYNDRTTSNLTVEVRAQPRMQTFDFELTP